VEVRARKVDYLRDYRGMLRDLATVMTEVVMQGFAASGQRFASDTTRDPPTLYQRFALLRSLLDDGALDAALREAAARGEGDGSRAVPVLRTLAWLFALREPS
jgi:hypothetical protein